PMSSIGGVPIALSPDGKRLAWQQFMGDLLIVDAVSGKVQQTIPRRSALAQRNDPRNAPQAQRQPGPPGQAGGARARLEAMKAQRAQQQAQGGGQGVGGQAGAGQGGIPMSRTILGLVFSPDGSQLAARTQGAVAMFDTTTGKRAILKSEFAWPKDELPQIVSIGFTGQAYCVACCTSDGTVRRYDTITGTALGSAKIAIDGMAADAGQRRTLIGGALRGSAIFSPDGSTIAALDKEGIALWDVASGKKLRTLPQPRTEVFGKRMSVSDIHNTFSPTGRLLVSPVGTSTIHVWDTQTGELKHKIELEGNAKIVSTAVSFYGNLLAAGDSTGTIRIWKLEAKTAEPVAEDEK
ncbi:MAG: hypothetical protein K8T91_21350, partial [Planctomycetes bacterium]|nr:hypothetical protein [Planctomycetota bacterium]